MAMMNKRILAALTVGAMCVSLLPPVSVTATAAPNTIVISTAEELAELAESFTLDSRSKGKTVTLTADIDLGYSEFSPIPTFGGTFNGNGYTISGLKITASGSSLGLFRYVEKGGRVENLNVIGIVMPEGSQSSVGGIVGKNSGTIKNCAFRGSITGETKVGGIAGQNAESGSLISCEASGTVRGKTATGGIAGSNSGMVMNCENNAGINLTQSEETLLPSDINVDDILGGDTNEDEDNILNSCSDTGGVAGYSDGIVQSCTNNGDVGYPHVGYNTGGIAGRQSGYLSGCVNNGTIHGRKEVGGIVGQTEPYLSITPSEDLLNDLQTELDKLNNMINDALNDTSDIGNTASNHLTNIKNTADIANENAQSIANGMDDFVNGNIDAVNMLTADISNAIELAKPAADDFAELGTELSTIADLLSETVDIMKDVSDMTDDAAADIEKSIDDMKTCSNEMKELSEKLGDALDALRDSVSDDDEQAVRDALDALADVIDAANELLKRISDDADSSGDIADWITGGNDDDETQKDIDALTDALEKFGDSLQAVSDMLPDLADGLDEAGDKLKGASDNAKNAADALSGAMDSLQNAADDLEPINDSADAALDKLKAAADHTSYSGTLISHALECVSNSLDSLSNMEKDPFKPLSGDVRRSSDEMFDALSKIFDEADAMNLDLNGQANALNDKIKAINEQMGVITDLVIDEMRTITDANVSDRGDYIQDTSEEDIAATREGKVADCRNNGAVDGDRNIGGISGAMAIEYDRDPEDEITDELNVHARFETKSVLQGCVNYGEITAKKDCAGGLAGRMDLGTMINCQNYGTINGSDYVGGAAGMSSASVRNCYTKSRLSGATYIGGIAGFGDRISGCRAITTILEYDEFAGAIAGEISKDGALKDNAFVDTGIAGVDNISYTGKAEPIEFNKLAADKDVPAEMLSFNIILNADGELIGKLPFTYGQNLSKTKLPEPPQKDGFYGVWGDFDKSGTLSDIVLEAEYKPIVSITQSDRLDGKLALALASGAFTESTELLVEEQDDEKPVGAGANAKIYHLKLENSDIGEGDSVSIRLLNPGSGKANVWIMDGGSWKQISAEQNGKYMLAEMEGTEAVFCIASPETRWIPFAAGGAAAVIVLIVALNVRKARKHKKEKTAVNSK